MKTITLASIYEQQGLNSEALALYKELLKKDSNNIEVKKAIRRLNNNSNISNTQILDKMSELFVNMDSEVEYKEFERWLIKELRFDK